MKRSQPRTHPDLDCEPPSPRYDFTARLDQTGQAMSYEWGFQITACRTLTLRVEGDRLVAAIRPRVSEEWR